MFRRSCSPALLAVAIGLIALPACKKKVPEAGGDASGLGIASPPPAVKSEYVAFARLDAKQIREGALFTELKAAFAGDDLAPFWDEFEKSAGKELGFKPTDIDTVTAVVTGVPQKGPPLLVVIVTAAKPIPKTGAFGIRPGATPDSRGFYAPEPDQLAHFPDEKTIVLLSRELADKYLAGFAKDRSGWPLTGELTQAAAGHTAFVHVQMDKLPGDTFDGKDREKFGGLTDARTLTVALDLKGKELTLAARAAFADPDTAVKARDKGRELLKQAAEAIGPVLKQGGTEAWDALLPAVKEAERAVKGAKLQTSGPDLTLVASYKVDIDFKRLAGEAKRRMAEAGTRVASSENLKQIVLALHNYESTHGTVPVHCDRLLWMRQPGKPGLSWRVSILPYIGHEDLYKQFKLDEPWDGPNNKKLIDKMPAVFAIPGKSAAPGQTYYQMAIGPKAMQPPGNTIIGILDGSSNTIAVVEAADAVVWTKPADVMLPGQELPKDFRKKFGGHFPGGFHAAMWDGSVRFVRDSVSDRTLGFALDPRDGQVMPSDW